MKKKKEGNCDYNLHYVDNHSVIVNPAAKHPFRCRFKDITFSLSDLDRIIKTVDSLDELKYILGI